MRRSEQYVVVVLPSTGSEFARIVSSSAIKMANCSFSAPNSQPPAIHPIPDLSITSFIRFRACTIVHMNQGNPKPGPFAEDNGIYNDGGLILKFSARHVGLFLRFQTQWLPTDNQTGHRLVGAKPIPAQQRARCGRWHRPDACYPSGSLYRTRLDQSGGQRSRQRSCRARQHNHGFVNLTGWSIVDRNNHADVLHGLALPPGESRNVVLSGDRAQLGNKGGTITLKNQAGDQIHAVS